MERYICTVCGYVYDPEQGDQENEVDGVVKTIFLSFLDAVPGEERVAEG